MQKSSYAFFYGINAWIRKCSKEGGCIDYKERNRMNYIQEVKTPIDEVGSLIQHLQRIDTLYLSFQRGEREPSFSMYMVQALLSLKTICKARCFYTFDASETFNPDHDLLREIEKKLVDPGYHRAESHLPKDMEEMYFLLQTISDFQQRGPDKIPAWLRPMPA